MGDNGAVRSAQAALRGEAAVEGAYHERGDHGGATSPRFDASCGRGSQGGAPREAFRAERRHAKVIRRRRLRRGIGRLIWTLEQFTIWNLQFTKVHESTVPSAFVNC